MRKILVGGVLFLSACSSSASAGWLAVSTTLVPSTTTPRVQEVRASSTIPTLPSSAPMQYAWMEMEPSRYALCLAVLDSADTFLTEDMDDAEVLRALRFSADFFHAVAAVSPTGIRVDVEASAHNYTILADAWETGEIDHSTILSEMFTLPGIDPAAVDRVSTYLLDHCLGEPAPGA